MSPTSSLAELGTHLDEFLRVYGDELIHLRRDLRAHPELARQERRTTTVLAQRLAAAGAGSGGVAIGAAAGGRP